MSDPARQFRMTGLFAWPLGVLVCLLAYFSGNSAELPPELWKELSVSAFLRPPADEFPSLWRICLSIVIGKCSIGTAIELLKISGPISLGLVAAMTYRLFTGLLPEFLKDGGIRARRGRWISRCIAATGTLVFVCSEPVYLAGRVLSPEMAALLVTESVILLALAAAGRSSRICMVLAGAVLGVLAAETPVAFALAVGCHLFLNSKFCAVQQPDAAPLSNPMVFAVTARRTAYSFVVCWIGTVCANLAFFRDAGGGSGSGVFADILGYLFNYVKVIAAATSPAGWILMFTVVFAPFVVVMSRARIFTDTSRMLSVPAAVFTALAGAFSILQASGFSSFHFWKWEGGMETEAYLLCLCMLATSATAVVSLCVLAVDIYLRNNPRLMREMFPFGFKDVPLVYKTVSSMKSFSKMLRLPARFMPAVLVFAVIPSRFDTTTVRMSSAVNDIVYATAGDCSGATMLFSDGSFDEAVEVVSAMEGGSLKALSLMSGQSAYDIAVRLRGETDANNASLLKTGAAEAMRTWVQGGYSLVSNIAVQVGFELWRKEGLSALQFCGFAARTVFADDEVAARSVESAHEVAERMIALCREDCLAGHGYPALNRLFVLGQWRLARMCAMRAQEAERLDDPEGAEEERRLADALNELNPEWRKIQERVNGMLDIKGMHLTAREGLDVGLARADFRVAAHYARQVLADRPDDMKANFALGMSCFVEKRYKDAEVHLEKCLVKAPDEPAVLNNLAVVQLRLGRLEDAKANAERALKLLPESQEIKATLRHISKAMEKIK